MSLFTEACRYIPGGVNSPVRAFRGVGGEPVFFSKAAGAHAYAADGRRFIDYVGSWGPMIVGHAHPQVIAEVQRVAADGLSFGAPTELETHLARRVTELVPSIELVRFVSSGTEATMSAIRLARGFTGREKIVKFEGCYHGHSDSLLIKAGSGALTFGVPTSPGVPLALAQQTVTLNYNDAAQVRDVFRRIGAEIACVIVEPVAGNMNCVLPAPGFLETLREECDRCGALLIFDEVMTGFRVALGGAQALFGDSPRPDDARQDHRRRHAGRRIRRPARRDGTARAARVRSTRRGRCRATRFRWRPASRPWNWCRHRDSMRGSAP